MFGKVKRWLGIEGVKVELLVPEEVSAKVGKIDGKIRFFSMHEQTVQTITIKVIERYKRGRGKSKLVDEYLLGEIFLEQDIQVPEQEHAEIDFSLPFDIVKSDMDTFADRNPVFRGLAGTAKLLKGVRSTYRIEAEADVKGTALNPFDRQEFKIIK